MPWKVPGEGGSGWRVRKAVGWLANLTKGYWTQGEESMLVTKKVRLPPFCDEGTRGNLRLGRCIVMVNQLMRSTAWFYFSRARQQPREVVRKETEAVWPHLGKLHPVRMTPGSACMRR